MSHLSCSPKLVLCLQSVLFEKRKPVSASTPGHELPLALSQQSSDGNAAPAKEIKAPAALSFANLQQSAKASWQEMSWPTAFLLGATGAAAGVASGLLGIGGGTIVVCHQALPGPCSRHGIASQSRALDCLLVLYAMVQGPLPPP